MLSSLCLFRFRSSIYFSSRWMVRRSSGFVNNPSSLRVALNLGWFPQLQESAMLMVEKMPPSTTDSLNPAGMFSTVRLYSIEDCSSRSGSTSQMVKLATRGERRDSAIELSSLSQTVELRKSQKRLVLAIFGELLAVRCPEAPFLWVAESEGMRRAGWEGLASWASDSCTSYICSAQAMASWSVNLSSLSVSSIFSSRSNALTVRLISMSELQICRARSSFFAVTSSRYSQPQQASERGSKSAISRRDIASQKIAHFWSSMMAKSINFSGEQYVLGWQEQRGRKSATKGSMILSTPSPKISICSVLRKMVPKRASS